MAVLRTTLLLGVLAGIFIAIGFALAGTNGATAALILAALFNLAVYWYSDKFVLRMYRAREMRKSEHPEVHQMVERLAKHAGIPKPRLYVVPLPILNAFATGRSPNHSVVALTEKIMEELSDEELEGVLAHELSHIKNRDMLVATMAATIAAAVGWIAQMAWWTLISGGRDRQINPLILLPALILAPIAATLVQLAISRTRELGADYTGALVSKKPLALASALEKISAAAKHQPLRRGSEATASLFIVNPFTADSFARLFMTHPPVDVRVRRLREIAKSVM